MPCDGSSPWGNAGAARGPWRGGASLHPCLAAPGEQRRRLPFPFPRFSHDGSRGEETRLPGGGSRAERGALLTPRCPRLPWPRQPGSGPGSSSGRPVTVPGVTLPAQPALRHPVPPLESTAGAAPPTRPALARRSPGPRSRGTSAPPVPPPAPLAALPAPHRLLEASQREGGSRAAAGATWAAPRRITTLSSRVSPGRGANPLGTEREARGCSGGSWSAVPPSAAVSRAGLLLIVPVPEPRRGRAAGSGQWPWPHPCWRQRARGWQTAPGQAGARSEGAHGGSRGELLVRGAEL